MGRGEDRISSLSDELLQSILCLMPLKYAIRTSTLSKRWIHLWQFNLISSTSLQFDEDFSLGQSPEQFSATLDRYLQLHGNRNLDKFGISFPPFENWIPTVLAKGVKELDICSDFVIPDSLFNFNSLTHLSLSCCQFSDTFDFTNFAGLISLSLDCIDITEMLTDILETCVSLESISLMTCQLPEQMVEFEGDKLKLRKLVMVDCLEMPDSYLVISAPKLESFVFHGMIWTNHYFINVSNVTDTYLCFAKNEYFDDVVFEVLSEFSHVKILTLSSFSLMLLVDEEEQFEGMFPIPLGNLQELQLILSEISEEHLCCVFSFFHICPSPFLEKLFIQCPSEPNEEDGQSDLVAVERDIPDVVFQTLIWIKITNFNGSLLELKLVKFLLKKAPVLESIFLVMNQCDKSNKSLSERIQGQLSILPKASIDARIVICEPSEHDCTMNPTHRTYATE